MPIQGSMGRRVGMVFAVREEKADAPCVGHAELQPRAEREASISYTTHSEHRGRGIATAAVRILAVQGLTRFGFHRIELASDVENVASRRVAERAGFTFEGVARGTGRFENYVPFRRVPRDTAIYSLLASDL
jgi:RimJ/RimL family protein N-acetyltransferase